MAKARFTLAQERALAWLPPDGSWSSETEKLSSSVLSLKMFQPTLVEIEWRDDPRGGRSFRARATDAGLRQKVK
jgi:hypothetical protein